MLCPFCDRPLKQFGEDTFYWYLRCKNPRCPEGREFMQPKDDPSYALRRDDEVNIA